MTAPDKAAAGGLYAYLLVRTDLPSLGRGKGHAHSMHAGNHMTWRLAVEPLKRGEPIPDVVSTWHMQGGGFGTTIALGTRNQIDLATLTAVVEAARVLGHKADVIVDRTYPYEVDTEIFALIDPSLHTAPADRIATGYRCYRRETTTAWILGEKNALGLILSRFGLVPNE